MKKFPPEVRERLKSYVYLYIDPRNEKPFYVGKGVGDRAFAHLDEEGDKPKAKIIKLIRKAGLEPRIEMLRFGLSEDQASLVEASVIDFVGLSKLSNLIRGQHNQSFGRVRMDDLLLEFAALPARIAHRTILITINQLYRSDMTSQELCEATRGFWVVGVRRESVEIAMAVYQGIVREVYRIKSWHPAGTLAYHTREAPKHGRSVRWEFDAEIAEDLRPQYLHRSVGKSGQNPIRYVNC